MQTAWMNVAETGSLVQQPLLTTMIITNCLLTLFFRISVLSYHDLYEARGDGVNVLVGWTLQRANVYCVSRNHNAIHLKIIDNP